MVLHDEILDLTKFGIKYLTIECQPDEELEQMLPKKQLMPLRY